MSKRRPWTEEEKRECKQKFNDCFTIGFLPGKFRIESAIKEDAVLNGRTWIQIKNYIRNNIKKN